MLANLTSAQLDTLCQQNGVFTWICILFSRLPRLEFVHALSPIVGYNNKKSTVA